ncbi:hypothetical protein [Kiloniella litopenaei]|uniref:hypothetical protein n=1 Tax=Kiloniella litopenaei TaxID=1549748 RepID=UPI003BA93B6F
MRQLPMTDYQKIVARTRRLVEAVGGGKEAASLTRVNETSISNYLNINHEQFMPADVVADLERVAGEPLLSGLIAELSGGHVTGPEETDPIRMFAALNGKLGELCRKACEYADDNHYDNYELDDLIKQAEALSLASDRAHDNLCRMREQRRVKSAAE